MHESPTWAAPSAASILPPTGSHVHLIGIGGAGMRGLAALLMDRGLRVTGSDSNPTATDDLPDGIVLDHEQDLDLVREADLVVFSSAVPGEHPKRFEASRLSIPSQKRAAVLGALLNEHRLVGIAGTHGKTTVTAMTAVACEASGLDPTALVGGRVPAWQGFTRTSAGDVAIVEADEYDRSFLRLDPSLAVVTAVEAEHLESYGTFEVLVNAFVEFASRAAGRDGALVCADDVMAVEVARRAGQSTTYGFDPSATWRVDVLETTADRQIARLRGPHGTMEFHLGTPGRHNVQNAAAALSAALILGADQGDLPTALAEFRGVERRLQLLSSSRNCAIYDDYAHHPTEVRASIEALRAAYPSHRLVVVFQPHLFSRTRDMAAAFGEALEEADLALVLPIYPSREAPIEGVTADLIVRAAGENVQNSDPRAVESTIVARQGSSTVIAFMGAGDVTALAHRMAQLPGSDELGG